MKVLVTGGAGFIGSHTCVALLEKGYQIVVLDSYINSNKKSINRVIETIKAEKKNIKIDIEVVESDIRNIQNLDNLFSESEISGRPIKAVIHFAGLKCVKESIFNPLRYWDVNVNGTIKLLEIMDKYNCRTIVFSSSATIYAPSNKIALSEKAQIKPVNPYGRTKAGIEQLLNDLHRSNSEKWKIANLRYFNPIGAHSSGLIGESPIGIPNNIFPYITQVANGNLEKLTIYGNDWPTNDGTGVRDYIHVMDIAEGHLAALEYLKTNKPQIINLNLGTGLGTSVLELVNIFESVNEIKIPYKFSERREGDLASVIADNNYALDCLDWIPKRQLEQMCSDGWRWQVSNPEGYK